LLVKSEKIKILKEILGSYYNSGEESLFYCPSCKHHKKKLSVNLSLDMFKCWICDYRGKSLYHLVRRWGSFSQKTKWQEFENEHDMSEVPRSLKDIIMGKEQEEEQEENINLPTEYAPLANRKRKPTSFAAINYLKQRGITQEDILRWKIGYCDTGEYEGRIIIPSFNTEGLVDFFVARTYSGDWIKYKNPPTNKKLVFNELFVDWHEDITLVEGVFDAIKAGNAIPLLGSTLTEKSPVFQKIVENDSPVYMALDADAEKKTIKIIKNMLSYGIEVFKIDVSGFEDVGCMTKEEFNSRKQKAKLISNTTGLLREKISTLRG